MTEVNYSYKLLLKNTEPKSIWITFLFTIMVLLLISCENTQLEDNETCNSCIISIQPGVKSWFKMSDVFDNEYKVIKLNSNNGEGLIGNIDKIRFANDKIFILDRDKTKSLFIFSKQGDFITKISNYGEGPGQYKEIGDFQINTEQNIVYLLNSFPAKFLTYDFNGAFLSEKKISNYAWQFEFNRDSILFLYNFNMISSEIVSHDLLSYDRKLKIIDRWFPIDPGDQSKFVELPSNFCRFDDSISFVRPFTDTVFDVTSGKIKVKYVFDFGKHNIPPGFFENKNFRSEIPTFFKKAQKLIDKNKYVSNIQPFFESKCFFYMMYRYQSDSYHNIYLKDNKKMYTFNKVKNDIIVPLRFGKVVKVENDKLMTMVDAIYFKNDIAEYYNQLNSTEKNIFFHKNKELVNIALSTENSDNPLLIVYTLKNNN